MAVARGMIPLFDFGPPIEELKSTCQHETGLPPPATPRFARGFSPPRS
jgi:N-methylhydantoinase B